MQRTNESMEGLIGNSEIDESFFDASNFHDEATQTSPQPSLPTLPLSRQLPTISLNEAFATSSDPPLFSSDDLPASSAENYLQPHRKRQHRRAWYDTDLDRRTKRLRLNNEQEERQPRAATSIERNFDSGVFLESDEAEEAEDSAAPSSTMGSSIPLNRWRSFNGYSEQSDRALDPSVDLDTEPFNWAQLADLASKYVEDPGVYEGPVWPFWQPQPKDLDRYHALQRRAAAKVGAAFDSSSNSIDLSDGGYEELRSPTLRLLRYMTKPTEQREHFSSLKPDLSLYLSKNALTEVPGEVYHLPATQVLSLRGNRISEILPSIGNLKELKELNLGSNQLEYLPWEVFLMIQTRLRQESGTRIKDSNFSFFPNPFLRAMPHFRLNMMGQKNARHSSSSRSARVAQARRAGDNSSAGTSIPEELSYMASTRTAFIDIGGRSLPSYPPAPTSQSSLWVANTVPSPSSTPEAAHPSLAEQSQVPSLLELSLRSCYKSSNLSQAPFLLPRDASPHLIDLVKRAFKLREAGGQECTICGKFFIVPRTEWIEWWYCNPFVSSAGMPFPTWANVGPIPFLRRGCSWRCWEEREGAVFTGWSSARADDEDEGVKLCGRRADETGIGQQGSEGSFTQRCLQRNMQLVQAMQQHKASRAGI